MTSIEKEKIAINIYNKLKFYCDFHGLNILNSTFEDCINDLILLIE